MTQFNVCLNTTKTVFLSVLLVFYFYSPVNASENRAIKNLVIENKSIEQPAKLVLQDFELVLSLPVGVTEENISHYCEDLAVSNIDCKMSLFKFSPSLGFGLTVTTAQAHEMSEHFLPSSETTITDYNAGQLYTLLVQLAISYGGENMLLHMRTLKRIFAPVAPNELEDWNAFILRNKNDPENAPAAFYFFVNSQSQRCVYVSLKR